MYAQSRLSFMLGSFSSETIPHDTTRWRVFYRFTKKKSWTVFKIQDTIIIVSW